MLVGVGALLLQVHNSTHLDVGAAVIRLARQPPGILLVIAFALVLTTMVIQAFAFDFIRLLEGYWGPSRLAGLLAGWRIRRHTKRMKALERAQRATEKRAFRRARERMLRDKIQMPVIMVLEMDFAQYPEESFAAYPEQVIREAISMGWRTSAPAWSLRRVDAVTARLSAFPEPYRLLPTTLGNTLRSYEDQLKIEDGGDLQGFVIRNYDRISGTLLTRHSQSRTRLDMYCSLVFVFAVIALSCIPMLWKFPLWHLPALIAAALFCALACVSYAAAIASAGGYGSVMLAIDAQVSAAIRAERRAAETTTSTGAPSSAMDASGTLADGIRAFVQYKLRRGRRMSG